MNTTTLRFERNNAHFRGNDPRALDAVPVAFCPVDACPVYDLDDTRLCEICGGRACFEHTKRVEDLDICDKCRVCSTCTEAPVMFDDEGNMYCASCAPKGTNLESPDRM